MSLSIGDPIPQFSLKDQNGNTFDVGSVLGKQNLVIYFYPKNFTPGCTKEACGFRDHYEDFQNLGATVIGISSDSEKSHQKFADKYKLPFILLTDEKGIVKRKFGVKNQLLGLIPGRETYVINKKGEVMYVFNSINADKHIQKALKVLKKTV